MQEHFRARFPKEPGRQRRRVSRGDSRKGARHAPRPAARRRAVEHGAVRDRPGVRSAAASHARQSAGRVSRVRRPDADRAAKSDSGVSHARRSTRSRRPVDAISRRDAGRATERIAERFSPASSSESRPEVTLTDFDPDGEIKVVAAALYAVSDLPDDQLFDGGAQDVGRRSRAACCAPTSAIARTGATSRGARSSGRAIASTCSSDYGAFRDLQRHRLLTLEWQPLGALSRLCRAGRDRGSGRAQGLDRA